MPELTPSVTTSEESQLNGHSSPRTPQSAGAADHKPSKIHFHNGGPPVTGINPNASISVERQRFLDPATLSLGPFKDPKEKGGLGFIRRKGDHDEDARTKKESKKELKKEKEEREKEDKMMKDIEARAIKDTKEAAKKAKKGSRNNDGNTTEYESDGGYLSEASVSSKKSRGEKKSGSSFFRRKSKPKPVDVDTIPPMPTAFQGPNSSLSTSTSIPSPIPSGSMPPIAARFATSNTAPSVTSIPSPSSSFMTSTPTITSARASPSSVPTPSPRPTPIPSPAPTSAPSSATFASTRMFSPPPREDDSVSSHSSDISVPTSLPTSTSSHKKPSRPGLFGFGGSSDSASDARGNKLNISLPLTASRVAGSSNQGASPIQSEHRTQISPILGSASRKGKPILEVELLVPPPPASGDVSPATSYVMVTPTGLGSSPRYPSKSPDTVVVSPNLGSGQNHRPTVLLNIQHPHEYNGIQQSTSPLPSPPPRRANSLAPPPTPPPTCPLPRPPPQVHSDLGPSSVSPMLTPELGSHSKRGREKPFPVTTQSRREFGSNKLDGYKGRIAVPRYRGLYGLERDGHDKSESVGSAGSESSGSGYSIPTTMITPADMAIESPDDEKEDEEDFDPGMLQPRRPFDPSDRERFSAVSVPVTEPDRYHDSLSSNRNDSFISAVGNRFPYEHLSSFFPAGPDTEQSEGRTSFQSTRSDDKSIYPDDDKTAGRSTMYEIEGRGRDVSYFDDDGRFSRYSATPSTYSVLDHEKSEEVRDRFIKRVAAMYDERERDQAPPVPSLPDGIIRGTGVGRRRLNA